MNSRIRTQNGSALFLALVLMAVAVPLVTATLSLASALSVDSTVKTRILKRQYANLGAMQYATYRLLYEDDYAGGMPEGGQDSYSVTLNDEEVFVTIFKLSDPPPEPTPPPADDSRRLSASKTVSPSDVLAGVDTNFTYTIEVQNRDDEEAGMNQVFDELPPNFSYVPGSTSGVITSDPTITGQKLKWNLSNLQLRLQPQESSTLRFSARATLPQGVYCNEAWADPGGGKTSTRKTARVISGSPANSLCPGKALLLTKTVDPDMAPANRRTTYTYTIIIEGIGTDTLQATAIRDLLPEGFLYVPGSTTGDITTTEPNVMMSQGRQRLDWSSPSNPIIPPGETRELVFRAEASVEAGYYWNEAWVDFSSLSDSVYTWPSAMVKVLGVFRSVVSAANATLSCELWVGLDSNYLTQCYFDQ